MDPKIINQFNQINVEPLKLFRPVLSGLILNAFYSCLLLKQASGIEITHEIHQETMDEVIRVYRRIDTSLLSHFDGKAPQNSPDQGQ